MEYISGASTLTDYAEKKQLDVKERLLPFQEACDAVHHGHQRGIIHRDLKPDNILIDSRGRLKIIDFGVARATDSDMALTTMQTSVGQLVGTLQYMSPEQIHGDPNDIDTRSDVYSLGVILCELLCRSLPYEVSKSLLVEATRVIQKSDPARPSTVDCRLRGDVEVIVLKALEKERERRYQSAHGLSQDIGRYLRGDPIVARAPSLVYQLGVLARRNRALLIGVLGVILALFTGLVVSTTLYLSAESAREHADTERNRAMAAEDRAQLISDFLVEDLLGAADPREAQGREITVLEVVRAAADKVGASFSDRPELEVPIRVTLGDLFYELGQFESAGEQLEAAVELAE